jgi:ribosomal protein L7/L12
MANPPADPQHERICETLFEGRKIEAIKLYRELAGVGLKDAKEFIDALEARLKREQPDRFKKPAASAGGCTGMLVLLAGMIAVALIFWLLR